MSGDRYKPGDPRVRLAYPCGLRAGDRLRLKEDLHTVDHLDRPTGESFRQGSLWTVAPGTEEEPSVVWLCQPDGAHHTWDETVLDTFEVFAHAPRVGEHASLASLPTWVAELPPTSQRLFRLCVGRPLPVDDIDHKGLIVLDASVFDDEVGESYNDIRVEAELLQF